MVTIKSVSSTRSNTEDAYHELISQIHTNPQLIIFFSSTTQNFKQLSDLFHEQYPQSEVIGLTTSGEIGPKGLLENSVAATSFEGNDFRAKGVLIEDIVKYPIFYRDQLLQAAEDLGINPSSKMPSNEGLGLVFPNGIVGAEEKMLSIVNSIFDGDGFPLFGGTAGDDIKFKATYVSYNGVVSSTGGVVVFIKTSQQFYIQKENIFVSTGKKIKITKADTENRIVLEINGNRASDEYARLIGVSTKELPNYFMTHPIGRAINDEVYIASPFQVLSNGAIQFYCQIFENATVDLLKPKDPIATLHESLTSFQNKFNRLEGVLAINCILRKLQFKEEGITNIINQNLEKLPNLSGFVSYGEQLNNMQLNQTFILLGFGSLK